MGFVWNVMLSFDNEELWEDGEDEPRESCEPLERINAWISHGRLVSLIEPTHIDDAGYGMDANLYGGGFKHFDIEGFIEVVKAQDWKEPSKVQLWVKGAEEGMGEEPFTLIRVGRPKAARSRSALDSRHANIVRGQGGVGMVLRFYEDPDTSQLHIYGHGVTEQEVEEVLRGRGEDLRAPDNSRRKLGQTSTGRYLQVFYVPDEGPDSVFVITASELHGKAKRAFRRRQRRKSK